MFNKRNKNDISYAMKYIEEREARKRLEREKEELQKELELHKNDALVQNGFYKISEGWTLLEGYICDDEIKEIEIIARMRSFDAEECFAGIIYEVSVWTINNSNEKHEVFRLPVHKIYDGCIISQYAVKKRLAFVEMTYAVAEFIKKRIEVEYMRRRKSIIISISEEKIDDLLKSKSDITVNR
ncbi:hypothetical protein [Bacillus sp. NPDC094106]|uniref:hypothetical protein n=1 Tax=Bacillus sp. NPDC094106 TaxID=3363949 RepID=UPI0037F9570A